MVVSLNASEIVGNDEFEEVNVAHGGVQTEGLAPIKYTNKLIVRFLVRK